MSDPQVITAYERAYINTTRAVVGHSPATVQNALAYALKGFERDRRSPNEADWGALDAMVDHIRRVQPPNLGSATK